ncbi:hypothetical protein M885DRAFT_504605 [Pelagophyceae sp. CCMP2097]|nr:hypothetical protein M885DRAFT_504605 [Pelagophyceae sp. CCMP2097]
MSAPTSPPTVKEGDALELQVTAMPCLVGSSRDRRPSLQSAVQRLLFDHCISGGGQPASFNDVIADLIWSDKHFELAPPAAEPKEKVKARKRSSGSSVVKDNVATRMTRGENASVVDKNGNTAAVGGALSALVADRTGNCESGATFLRRLVSPSDDGDSDGDGDVAEEEASRTAFDFAPSQEVLKAFATAPGDRGPAEMRLLNEHLGWHPFFRVLRGRVKQRMLRHVLLESFDARRVVFLQFDSADSAYVVLAGKLAVHVFDAAAKGPAPNWADPSAAKVVLVIRKARIMAKEVSKTDAEVAYESEFLFGKRVATLSQGNAFGENGIVVVAPPAGGGPPKAAERNATILALAPTHLLRLTRSAVEDAAGRRAVPGAARAERDRDVLESFALAPHSALLDVLAKPPLQRTTVDIEIVARHCGWQPFFRAADDGLAVDAAYRHLKVLEFKRDEVIMLQGDLADCYFIVYEGAADVYVHRDGNLVNRWKGLNLWIDAGNSDETGASDTVRNVPLPLAVAGARVTTLGAGAAFGENGLDPAPGKRRSATVVACGAQGTVLLALYRGDIDKREAATAAAAAARRVDAQIGVDLVRRLSSDLVRRKSSGLASTANVLELARLKASLLKQGSPLNVEDKADVLRRLSRRLSAQSNFAGLEQLRARLVAGSADVDADAENAPPPASPVDESTGFDAPEFDAPEAEADAPAADAPACISPAATSPAVDAPPPASPAASPAPSVPLEALPPPVPDDLEGDLQQWRKVAYTVHVDWGLSRWEPMRCAAAAPAAKPKGRSYRGAGYRPDPENARGSPRRLRPANPGVYNGQPATRAPAPPE